MAKSRLELALSLLDGGDWRAFERFAAEFLAVEYPDLRTTASASGDGGRDAELYVPLEEPTTAIQISVRQDWDTKIRQTVKRLKETFPKVTELVYVTNQNIGAAADALKKSLRRDEGMSLDVRDNQWFIERENTYPQRAIASEKLAETFVDPIIRRASAAPGARSLKSDESQIALLQLVLDASDDKSDRNLTKSCFESIVIAVLRGTSAQQRLTREQVHAAIVKFVPAGAPGQLRDLVDAALARVTRKRGPVKHFRASDEFHLSYEESLRLDEQTAGFLLDEKELESQLAQRVLAMRDDEHGTPHDAEALGASLRGALETVLLEHSERFAASLSTGETTHLDDAGLLGAIALIEGLPVDPQVATAAIRDVLAAPSIALNAHLRRLSDSYTLFAFLRQTPDVQKVVLTVFAEGSIWMDTSAILPLIAETLLEEEGRFYTQLISAALDSGIKLYVTPGVIEEVERHLNRCVAFGHVPAEQWNGRVPFIYSAYILSGRDSREFTSWQDRFRGRARPEEDVRDFLQDEFSIEEKSLEAVADAADLELRAAVQELWMEQHDARRGADDDPLTVARLVAHDVENTVGVLQLRKAESRSPMGYRTWWLTMDKTALRFRSYLEDRLGDSAPKSSPALSPDFLSQYLRLGPMRAAIEKNSHVSLPVITDMSRLENVPRSLIELSDQTRKENAGLDERLLQRKVRDRMDYERTRRGPMAVGGSAAIERRIRDHLVT